MVKEYWSQDGELDGTAGGVIPVLDGNDVTTFTFTGSTAGSTLTYVSMVTGSLGTTFRGLITNIYLESQNATPLEGWAAVTVGNSTITEFHLPPGATTRVTPLNARVDNAWASVAASTNVQLWIMANTTATGTFSGSLSIRREPNFANVEIN